MGPQAGRLAGPIATRKSTERNNLLQADDGKHLYKNKTFVQRDSRTANLVERTNVLGI